MEHLDLAGKGLISDATVNLLLRKLVGQRTDVVYVNPTSLNVVVAGGFYYQTTHLKTFFYGLSTETVLLPVNCDGNHWCAIAIKLQEAAVLIYDPMGSSCMKVVRDLAKNVLSYLPPPPESKRRYHIRSYESDIGIETDSYNCGVFVLTMFEDVFEQTKQRDKGNPPRQPQQQQPPRGLKGQKKQGGPQQPSNLQNKPKQQNRPKCQGKKQNGNGQANATDRAFTCWNCGDPDHEEAEYPIPKKNTQYGSVHQAQPRRSDSEDDDGSADLWIFRGEPCRG
ncbi:hypothetical protein PR003_g9237 [Phytophthora rubi]|uniref:Ubiquitin-like protease family profile domain-containing protein n=1 Tax=Phytophthora rubi TaxID=129364 RepID=A0A6A4FGT6_9STRA|nr:hypothetical protein PR003_g9237 [Phytophthora rubi]